MVNNIMLALMLAFALDELLIYPAIPFEFRNRYKWKYNPFSGYLLAILYLKSIWHG
jgi:hypothetical protein